MIASRPRSRFASDACSSVASSIPSNASFTACAAVAREIPARSICSRTRIFPRRRTDVSVRAIASATRASSIARASRSRATASSIAARSCPFRARRWRTCSSESSRRASIFTPSSYALMVREILPAAQLGASIFADVSGFAICRRAPMRLSTSLNVGSALLMLCCSKSSIDLTSPTAVKCQVSVENSLSTNVPSAGVSGTLAVTTTRDCTWSATSNAAWAQLTGETTGQGSGNVGYRVLANPDAAQRRAVLEVNNTQVGMTQEAAPCRYTVSPASAAVPAAGGSVTIAIDTLNGCAWTAASDAPWLTAAGAMSASVSGSVTLRAAPNADPSPRSATVHIAEQSVVVTQAGLAPPAPSPSPAPPPSPDPSPAPPPAPPPTPCAFTLSATSARVASSGGSVTVSVTAGAGCPWTAASSVPWIVVGAGANGSGNGAVRLDVAANTSTSDRSGMVTIAGQTFAVTQAAAPPPCTFTVTPSAQSFPSAGGNGTVAIAGSQAGCAWTASSAAPWIALGATSGTGDGSVAFSVAANGGGDRSGNLTVAGRTLTMTQTAPPPPCTFAISPASGSAPPEGGSATTAITATSATGATCSWSATSNAPWLTITGPASGTGSGSVTVTAAANSGAARSGTVAISGQTFTMNQAAAPPPPPPPPCTFNVSPSSQSVATGGGTGSFAISASASTCTWTASSGAPWITITGGASGTGSGTTTFSAAANGGADRSGSLSIAGVGVTVTQPAAPPPPPCTFSSSPESQAFDATGGSGTVSVAASSSTCAWTASSGASWITIASGGSGAGNGSVGFSVDVNHGDVRAGSLSIAGKTFSVTQARGQ